MSLLWKLMTAHYITAACGAEQGIDGGEGGGEKQIKEKKGENKMSVREEEEEEG